MKKTIIALVVVSSMAFAGLASAGMGGCMQGGMGSCMQTANLDPVGKEKVDKFLADTTEIRKQLSVKHGEKMAMMRSEKPDPVAVGKVSGEIFDLHNNLRQKAAAAGVEQYMGRGGFGMGCGGGHMGHGRMGGGRGGMMGPGGM